MVLNNKMEISVAICPQIHMKKSFFKKISIISQFKFILMHKIWIIEPNWNKLCAFYSYFRKLLELNDSDLYTYFFKRIS